MARKQKVDEEEHNYWMSYSDMMAALFLVFILIISFTLVNYQKAKEDLSKTKDTLENKTKELESSEKEIEDIIGIRKKIAKALFKKFQENNLIDEIEIDEKTGDITLKSKILFDVDKSELKTKGKDFLKKFFPIYTDVLFSYDNDVSEIIIEGHTDNDGVAGRSDYDNYLYNLRLSQNRALSVVMFCINDKNDIFKGNKIGVLNKIERLKKKLTANGKSYSNLKYKEDSKGNLILDKNGNKIVDKPKSRRVEVKFRLKEDKMIDVMTKLKNQYNELPNLDKTK